MEYGMKNYLKFSRPVAVAFGLFALLGAIPVHAADVVMEEPPAPAAPMEEPPVNTWSGPYAGVSVGYGFSGDTQVDDGITNNSISTDGFLAGGFLGYNYQVGNIVAGAEADLGYSWESGSNVGVDSNSGVEGSLRARLGYAVSPDILLYATAGGAGKDQEVIGDGLNESNTMVGWTAGAGADFMVTEQVFGRVEYRYTDFGSQDFSGVSVDDKSHRVTVGLGVKF
jgi:outer membrane immunogenic protein